VLWPGAICTRTLSDGGGRAGLRGEHP